jgi:hypothetical protein
MNAIKSRYILAIDPSGNYVEGKGITGWVLFDRSTNKVAKFGYISASMYSNQFAYWDAHITLLDSLSGYAPVIVIEDFLLYSNRTTSQINSRFETPQLIGIIKYECYKRGIMIYVQTAVSVKKRWNNSILVKKGYLKETKRGFYIGEILVSDHIQDALRHAVHFATFGKEK